MSLSTSLQRARPLASSIQTSAPLRTPCRACLCRYTSTTQSPPPPHSQAPPHPRPPRRKWPYPLGLSLALLPGLYWLLSPTSKPLSPQLYSTQRISNTTTLTPAHKLISVTIPKSATRLFTHPYRQDGTQVNPSDPSEDGDSPEVVVQHMMVGAPDIQIERPYTPVNDPTEEGEVRMVIKRVKGGEVGRLAHSLNVGDGIEVRGPIPTFSIRPNDYDRIVMISSGTGIAPFLQLLSRISPPPPQPQSPSQSTSPHTPNHPKYDLIHLQPPQPRDPTSDPDWAVSAGYIPSLARKYGQSLRIHRPPPGQVSPDVIRDVLHSGADGERLMVLVCLPPHLMYPLCGGLTRTQEQGPLTGVLAEIGLRRDQVFKLQ